MTTDHKALSTHEKALDINLDPSRYGSFAEIGAGQEVGRWFFRVGGAAGTVARTVSAYDKKVSDALYGTAQRYVSSGRLLAMLDREYGLNLEHLGADRGSDTAFFAFADTVAAQNYRGNGRSDGWMGIRFQASPEAEPSDILIHVRMLDRDPLAQHEVLGLLGVNLVYGASRLHEKPDDLLASLLDDIGPRRIEIDMVEFSGPAFSEVDHRLISFRLVELGLSRAAMFSVNGDVLRPSEILYKKPVVLQRGRFRPPTRIHADIQAKALEAFSRDPNVHSGQIVSIVELGLDELKQTSGGGDRDFLDRIQALTAGSHSVLVSNYNTGLVLLAEHLRRYATSSIAVPVGSLTIRDVFRTQRLEEQEGGAIGAVGRLFAIGVRLYVYPEIDPENGERVELDSLEIDPELNTLFRYLREQRLIESLDGLPNEMLAVSSDEVYAMIRTGTPGWEDFVSEDVAAAIKLGGLFGHGGGVA